MHIIVLDTETLGVFDPSVYNLGYVVADTETGEVLAARDYVIRQIFDNPRLMKTAYYAWKRPIYLERLDSHECKRVYWGVALRILAGDIKRYNVREMWAYNSRFDARSIAITCEGLKAKLNPTEGGIKDIIPAIKMITESEPYKAFCKAHGFMTKHKKPRCQKKAETVYRFLTQNAEYVEEHTALADSRIEFAILMASRAAPVTP